jgi:hypothetical protein
LTPDLSTLQFSTYEGDTRNFGITALAAMPDGGAIFGGTRPSGSTPLSPIEAIHSAGAACARNGDRADRDTHRFCYSHLGVALSPGETFTINGAGFGNDATVSVNGAALIARSATTLVAAIPLLFGTLFAAQPFDFVTSFAATIRMQSGGASASTFAPLASAAPGIFRSMEAG